MGKFGTFSGIRHESFERIVDGSRRRNRANHDDLGLCRYTGKQHPEGTDCSAEQKQVNEQSVENRMHPVGSVIWQFISWPKK